MTEPKKKKRKKKHYLLRLILAALLLAGAYYGMQSSFFLVENLECTGNSFYSDSEIIRISGDPTGELLWDVNLGGMQALLVSDPYIETAEVKRMIPDGIRISVKEREEFCAVRLPDSGYLILDPDGLVLRKVKEEPDLTILSGLTEIDETTGQAFSCRETTVFRDTLALTHRMEESNLWFREIECSAVTVRIVIYDDLVCEGTPESIYEHMDTLEEVLLDLFAKDLRQGTIRIAGDGSASYAPPVTEATETDILVDP